MRRIEDCFISFKGVRSDEIGAKLMEMPIVQYPVPKGQSVDIEGHDGALWVDDGGFSSITITAMFAIPDSEDVMNVLDWLSGSGSLILCDAPDYQYRASVILPGRYQNLTKRLDGKQINVTFTCEPFRYLVREKVLEYTDTTKQFRGNGNVPSKPIITVYGSGDITVMLNQNTVLFEDVDGYITLDCEAMMAFKGSDNMSRHITMLGDDADDEWPVLKPNGEINSLTCSASTGDTFTKIVIQPQWRWR